MIEGFLKQLLEEAALLGLSWWERIGVILALALLFVLGKGALRALGGVKGTPPPIAVPSDGSAPGDPGLEEPAITQPLDPVELVGPAPPENESGSGG